ncbi:MAG: thiol peroxidase [Deltaproteobacteria bacterium]|nr:thiol peroxidase [Deltaproteobacteria bacterium]
MTKITLKGNEIETSGQLPAVGAKAPAMTLTGRDLKDVTLADYAGKKKVISIFPSIDTGVCATSVRTFNQRAAELDGVAVLNVSVDLPFALNRFCGAEGIDNVATLSAFRSSFGADWGVTIANGGMRGLLSRAIVVLDADDTVLYTEQVPEIVQEPNYDAALAALRG